jgi:hypothetical protein
VTFSGMWSHLDAIAQIHETKTLAALLGGVAMATHRERERVEHRFPSRIPQITPLLREGEKCNEPLTYFSRCRL